ncbi:MAG: thioredoxin [Bacteroidota bacterium]
MDTTLIIIGFIVAIFAFYIFYMMLKMKNAANAKESEKLITLTDQNFQHQIKSGLTLVDFWAEWCMPCKMMAPIINSVAEEVDGNASVGKLNVEQAQATAAKYQVRSIPTLILFKNGKEFKRFVGVKNKEFLLNQIKQYQ